MGKRHTHEAALEKAKQVRDDCLAWMGDVASTRDEDMLTKGKATALAALCNAASREILQCENIMQAKAQNANNGVIKIEVDIPGLNKQGDADS